MRKIIKAEDKSASGRLRSRRRVRIYSVIHPEFSGNSTRSIEYLFPDICSIDYTRDYYHFPLSGNGTNPTNVNGYYWSSTPNNNNGYYLNLSTSAASVTNSNNNNQYSVRCVRNLSPLFLLLNMESKLIEDLFTAYFDARRNKRNTHSQLVFEMHLEENIYELYHKIESRTYQPKSSIVFIVDKPVKREIFAADFSDRVVQHLLFNYINPIFERTFIEDSYACRKGKGTLYAISRLDHHIRSCSLNYTRDCHILKMDIQGYFMSINRGILYDIIIKKLDTFAEKRYPENEVKSKDFLDFNLVKFLVEQIVFYDPTADYRMKGDKSDWVGLPQSKSLFYAPQNTGLPIGNLTSQLFSNIYLDTLDQYVKRNLRIKHYGRYVDDCFVVHRNVDDLKEVETQIGNFLSDKLRLTVHPKKTSVQSYRNGVLFCGGYIKPYRIYTGKHIVENFANSLGINKKSTNTKHIRASINAYLGVMCHTKSRNVKEKIIQGNRWVYKYGYFTNNLNCYRLKQQ